uniref:OvmZ homologue n=1 Tax=Streptomyces sp. (strain KO-3988) TaxID=285219 RepID=Q2L6D2_STREO|nr:ovmZ homologue [Streptomyces sp. KO-3988]
MELNACRKTPRQEPGEATESVLGAARIRQLEGNLLALPGLYRESLHHIAPISREVRHTRVSGSRSSDRLNMSALDTRHNILAILESWAEFVADGLGGIAPTRSVPHLANFLLRNLEWLTEQPPAIDFADEIAGLRLELLRTIDPEPAECHVLTWDCVVADCTGKITTSAQHGRTTDGRSIRCSSGHSWEMREWITLRPLMQRHGKAVGS